MKHCRIAVIADRRLGYAKEPAFSELWVDELQRRDVPFTLFPTADAVCRSADDFDGLLWRPEFLPQDKLIARRLVPVFERRFRGCVYPDSPTYWHYDDKIAQAYLFDVSGIPAPRSWIFWTLEEAHEFLLQASYPLVAKLAGGAEATNVRLVTSVAEGLKLCQWLFHAQLFNIRRPFLSGWSEWQHRLRAAGKIMLRGYGGIPTVWWEAQKGYVLFQEFLPGNDGDTRVCVIGDRAWAYRRRNRPGDFRASGSRDFDVDPENVDPTFVKLGFEVARMLGMQSCAIDCLYRGGEAVVVEASYAFGGVGLRQSPGTWVSSDTGPRWTNERRVPALEILDDVLDRINQQHTTSDARPVGASA